MGAGPSGEQRGLEMSELLGARAQRMTICPDPGGRWWYSRWYPWWCEEHPVVLQRWECQGHKRVGSRPGVSFVRPEPKSLLGPF